MNNKKSKKKLFAIIGGSVLAFVLTIVVSVAVTLAYFGDKATGAATITMDKAVLIVDNDDQTDGKQITMVGTTNNVLPGQGINVEGTVNIDANGSAAFIAIKPTFTDENNLFGEDAEFEDAYVTAPEGWEKHTDGYYYYVGDTTGVVKQVAAGGNAKLSVRIIVPTTLDNDAAEKAISVTFEVVAVQGVAFNSNGEAIESPTLADVAVMVAEVITQA